MNRKIRKGDQVIVITGNDRGKFGKVLSCMDDRVVVEGINLRKKHMRKSQESPKGQIIDLERSIHISNVKLAVDERPVKLRARKNKAGEKEYVYRGEGDAPVVYRSVRKHKG